MIAHAYRCKMAHNVVNGLGKSSCYLDNKNLAWLETITLGSLYNFIHIINFLPS